MAIVLDSNIARMLAIPFPLGEPMQVTFIKAKQILIKARDNAKNGKYSVLYRDLISNLDTAQCPDCSGTGISHVLEFGQPR